jgi:hypothetical protein
MRFLYAHAGESHTNTTENVVHTLKAEWPKIILVTAIFVIIMLAIVYAATNSSKKKTSKEASKETTE